MTELTVEYRTWMCLICGYLYDERSGDPKAGIAPSTRWEDVPEDWRCPECDVPKLDFEMVSI